jgi:hypothetical protein
MNVSKLCFIQIPNASGFLAIASLHAKKETVMRAPSKQVPTGTSCE